MSEALVLVRDCTDCGEQFTSANGDPQRQCGDCLQKRGDLPEMIWLCPEHANEFWVPHGGTCPACSRDMVAYSVSDSAVRSSVASELRLAAEDLETLAERLAPGDSE